MNAISARMVYENAIKNINRQFADIPGFDAVRSFKLTQSFLRLEQPLAVGQTLYNFPLLVNQASPQIFNTEQRLNLQDTFVISEIGFFIGLPSSSTDTTFKPLTYISPFLVTNDAQMQSIYNGQISITVNNNVLVPNWDLFRHWRS